jgi:hypothetical protein
MNTAAAAQPAGPAARPPSASAVAISMAAVPLTRPIFRRISGASISAATCASCEPDMINPMRSTGVCRRAKKRGEERIERSRRQIPDGPHHQEPHHKTVARIELGPFGGRGSDAQPRRRPQRQRHQRASGQHGGPLASQPAGQMPPQPVAEDPSAMELDVEKLKPAARALSLVSRAMAGASETAYKRKRRAAQE